MEHDETPRQRWWLAGLMSFLVPGLGQVYNGEAEKGLFYYFLVSTWGGVVFSLVYYLMKSPITRLGLEAIFLVFLISTAAYLFIILESILTARKACGRPPNKPYNRWLIYLLVILVVTNVDQSVSRAFRDNVLKPFKIPSRSMQPTIDAGDYLICDQLYYRYHNPARKDLIIFKYPKNERVDYIKRIVGLPGDTVELRHDILYINGRPVSEPYARYTAGPMASDADFGPVVVPENEYFVMGDNRDDSSDSRYFGTVSRQEILGKAVFVYFSWDMNLPWWDLLGRAESIRFSRIGKIL